MDAPRRLTRLFPDADPLSSRYSLGGELGHGSFGTVRRCTELETRDVAACKSVDKWPPGGYSRTLLDDIVTEVAVMRCLAKHGCPHIVTLKEVFEDIHSVHIVMELCKGGDLDEFLEERGGRPLSETLAAGIFRQLAAAVKVCHVDAGVLHRDIKPQNVLIANRVQKGITKEGQETVPDVKLADFGRSMLIGREEETSGQVTTYNFSAPETIPPLQGEFCTAAVRRRRGSYGFPADIWSLGCTLYLMLCGHLPFSPDDHAPGKENENHNQALFRAIIKGYVDFSSGPWAVVSAQAKSLISRMLASDPQKRPTIQKVLEHPWLQVQCSPRMCKVLGPSTLTNILLPEKVVRNVDEQRALKDSGNLVFNSLSPGPEIRRKSMNTLQWRPLKKDDASKGHFSQCSNNPYNFVQQPPLIEILPSPSPQPSTFPLSSPESSSSPSSSSVDVSPSSWEGSQDLGQPKPSGEGNKCDEKKETKIQLTETAKELSQEDCTKAESTSHLTVLPPSIRPLPPLKGGSSVPVSCAGETATELKRELKGSMCSPLTRQGTPGPFSKAKSYRSFRSSSVTETEQSNGA